MAYASVQDILNRYGPDLLRSLTRAYDGADLDTATVDQALADASAEIDLSLRSRVDLPLTQVPPIIKRLAIDLALAALPTDGAADQDLLQIRAKNARGLLSRIAAGELDLGLTAQGAAADEAVCDIHHPIFGTLWRWS